MRLRLRQTKTLSPLTVGPIFLQEVETTSAWNSGRRAVEEQYDNRDSSSL
jgi:hypothetical protein